MAAGNRVYLDHAATSWPKSESVLKAVDQFMRTCGAAAGRGGYRSATQSDHVVAMTRQQIGRLIGAEHTDCISFHANGTAALNAAIHGILRPGDHVVTSAAEHNSVLRPLHDWQKHFDVDVTIVPTDSNGWVDPDTFISHIQANTRLATLVHASNVTGTVQPIAEVGAALSDRDTIFLCDAAQTFGTLPIDVQNMHIDLLAAPGHKSSGGPLGSAFLYVTKRLHSELAPRIQGGTGSQSESLEMPESMPAKMEAGNLNVPALAGWSAALDEILSDGIASRAEHAQQLANHLRRGLEKIDHIRVLGQPNPLPIASILIDGLEPTDAALVLDAEYGVECRAGLHCAAAIHACLGTHPEGTLRISAGHTSTLADLDQVLHAISDITQSLYPE